jgi:hypothetical protein
MLNRQRFQLEMGMHPNKRLQADWSRLGPEAFEFEMLDHLKQDSEEQKDLKGELSTLLDLWTTKLVSDGRTLYSDTRDTE